MTGTHKHGDRVEVLRDGGWYPGTADVIALLGRELRWNQAAAEWQWRDGDVAIYAYKFGRVHSISVTRRVGSWVRGLDAHGMSWSEAERAWHAKSKQEGFGDA